MRCIALDDEPLALEILKDFCSKVPFLELEKTFVKASDAAKYLRKFPVDLLFLDIQMPDISGIDFYKSLAQSPMVIFTTAYSEYALEGFNLSAVDYLLKPLEFERFSEAVQKAQEYNNYQKQSGKQEAQYLYVRSAYRLVKIHFKDILFIETMDDYLKIHVENGKPVLTLMNLKAMEEKLSPTEFCRVHRSYIVPLDKINFVRNKMITISTFQIPIGNKYEEEFNKVYLV